MFLSVKDHGSKGGRRKSKEKLVAALVGLGAVGTIVSVAAGWGIEISQENALQILMFFVMGGGVAHHALQTWLQRHRQNNEEHDRLPRR